MAPRATEGQEWRWRWRWHPRARCSREKHRRFSWNVTHEKQRFRFLVFLLAKRFPVARDETEPWRRRRPGRPPAQGWHWSVRSVLAESVGPRGPRHRAREPPRPSSLFSPRESRVEPAHKGERELAVQGRERERERERGKVILRSAVQLPLGAKKILLLTLFDSFDDDEDENVFTFVPRRKG